MTQLCHRLTVTGQRVHGPLAASDSLSVSQTSRVLTVRVQILSTVNRDVVIAAAMYVCSCPSCRALSYKEKKRASAAGWFNGKCLLRMHPLFKTCPPERKNSLQGGPVRCRVGSHAHGHTRAHAGTHGLVAGTAGRAGYTACVLPGFRDN